MKYSLLIIIATMVLICCNNTENEECTKPQLRDISEYVYASTIVESKDRYKCRPSVVGIIKHVLVVKGDYVKKGQPLFSITPSANAQSRLENATINLKEMESNLYGSSSKLHSINVEIDRIKKQNEIDSTNYQRRIRLWNKNIGSKSELEHTQLSYESSTSRLKSLQLEYQQLRENLSNNLQRAKNQINTERNSLIDFIVKSEIDGQVFNIMKEEGEYISPQEVFAEIGNMDSFVIKMNIDEVDISKVEIGDTAIISLEAYQNKVYTSTLTYISTIKDKSTQTFAVEGIFVEGPKQLFNGLAGEANILVERRLNARVIPAAYLFKGNKVLTNDGEVRITTGVKNLDFVEIIDGVDTSIILLKPTAE